LPQQPGVLLNSEPFLRGVPAGAQAWRLLYTTTRNDTTPAVASAIVVAPTNPPPGPRPIIAWAHGTTGFAEGCAPSLAPDPFGSGALFILDRVIEQGWVLVATDYVGLGTAGPHPYLIGQGEGRSVLDAVRAAYQLTQVRLADQVVVWGHSQGGHAALWTGMLASSYAPDLHVLGVAALAPASDLVGLVDDLPNVTGGSVFAAYVVAAYTQVYSDVNFSTYVRPAAQVLVQEMSQRCLSEPGVFVSVLTALSLTRDPDIFALDPASGPFGERLEQNRPTAPIPVPLFIAQGLADRLVLPTVQQTYVAGRCAAGQALEYRTYAARDHVGLVAADSPLVQDLLDWTQARLRGAPPSSTCVA
jgi:acetyl esterase/lipase